MGTVIAPTDWIAKSQYSHATRFSEMRTTASPGFTPASTSADATASTHRRMSAHVAMLQDVPVPLWWTRGRSPNRSACRKKTPTVVRSAIASGSKSRAVGLLDRLDAQRQRSGWNADRDAVALLLADERATDRRVDRDPAGRRIALDGTDEVVGLRMAVGVDDVDRGARSGDARVRLLDDLGASDHLLQLVDTAVEEADLFLRLLILGVVLDVAGLERLLQALARLGPARQRNLKVALELLEPLGREQNRFCQIHPDLESYPSHGPLRFEGRASRKAGGRGAARRRNVQLRVLHALARARGNRVLRGRGSAPGEAAPARGRPRGDRHR